MKFFCSIITITFILLIAESAHAQHRSNLYDSLSCVEVAFIRGVEIDDEFLPWAIKLKTRIAPQFLCSYISSKYGNATTRNKTFMHWKNVKDFHPGFPIIDMAIVVKVIEEDRSSGLSTVSDFEYSIDDKTYYSIWIFMAANGKCLLKDESDRQEYKEKTQQWYNEYLNDYRQHQIKHDSIKHSILKELLIIEFENGLASPSIDTNNNKIRIRTSSESYISEEACIILAKNTFTHDTKKYIKNWKRILKQEFHTTSPEFAMAQLSFINPGKWDLSKLFSSSYSKYFEKRSKCNRISFSQVVFNESCDLAIIGIYAGLYKGQYKTFLVEFVDGKWKVKKIIYSRIDKGN